ALLHCARGKPARPWRACSSRSARRWRLCGFPADWRLAWECDQPCGPESERESVTVQHGPADFKPLAVGLADGLAQVVHDAHHGLAELLRRVDGDELGM